MDLALLSLCISSLNVVNDDVENNCAGNYCRSSARTGFRPLAYVRQNTSQPFPSPAGARPELPERLVLEFDQRAASASLSRYWTFETTA